MPTSPAREAEASTRAGGLMRRGEATLSVAALQAVRPVIRSPFVLHAATRRRGATSMRPGAGVPVVLLSSTLLLRPVAAAGPGEAPPFKLGTFEAQDRTFVGLVRADGAVVDVAAALA